MLFADCKEGLLAFHHVHKAHRHTDDQRRPQPGFYFFCDGQQGCGRIAHGKDGPRVLPGSAVHGSHGAGGARLLCRFGHSGVGHIADGLTAQLCKARSGNARQRHVGVGDDHRTPLQGPDSGLHRAGSKAQIFCVVEIGSGMDDPFDHRSRLRRRGQAQLVQFPCDNGDARPFNVGGQMMLRCHAFSPFGPARPMAA